MIQSSETPIEDSEDYQKSNIYIPTNEAVTDDEVLGIWADRKEDAQEIAREIREHNRKTT
jgi:hypothetical protein